MLRTAEDDRGTAMLPAGEESRIRSLAGMAHALSRPEPLFRLLELAAEEACVALAASSVSISRLEPGTMMVRTIVNVGDLGPGEVRWPEDETYALEEFTNLELVVDDLQTWVASVERPDSDSREIQLLRQLGKTSSLGSPIVVDGQLWGEFYATHGLGEPGFDLDDIAYLEALIAILAGAIARALREESLERLAYHDPLTGLPNRRALDQQAARAFDVPPGLTRTVTVVAVDINRLKEVNDSLGHVVGDQLIQSVAHALSTEFHRLTGSLVARVGGDEFTILVSGHQPGQVIRVADRLCQRTWNFGPGASISAGAASVELTGQRCVSPRDLFAAADRAQYVAKHGRLSSTVIDREVLSQQDAPLMSSQA